MDTVDASKLCVLHHLKTQDIHVHNTKGTESFRTTTNTKFADLTSSRLWRTWHAPSFHRHFPGQWASTWKPRRGNGLEMLGDADSRRFQTTKFVKSIKLIINVASIQARKKSKKHRKQHTTLVCSSPRQLNFMSCYHKTVPYSTYRSMCMIHMRVDLFHSLMSDWIQ